MKEFNFHISHQDIFPDREVKGNHNNLIDRLTVKIILFDEQENICLTSKTNSNFYFLPGGGVEKDEDQIEALKRECLEEAGCAILIKEKIGIVTESRDESHEKRIVYCYEGKVIGEKGLPALARDDEGFDVIWANVVDVIALLEKQLESISEQTDNFYARKFNTVRDLKIVKQP